MYYDDIKIENVVHRFFSGKTVVNNPCTQVNSLEFIRFGHTLFFHGNKEQKKTIRLTGPVLFWTRQGDDYQIIPDPENPNEKYIEHISIDFRGPRTSRMVQALYELYPDEIFVPESPSEFFDMFSRILQLYRLDPVKNMPEIGMRLEQIMFQVISSALQEKSEVCDRYGLEKIAGELRSNPFEDYDFSQIAASVGVSFDHFRRLFREKHRLPPATYLHHQRMMRAVELLEKTDMRIKEIVYTCRFRSEIDFSRSFKKYSGYSPRNYREKCKKDVSIKE